MRIFVDLAACDANGQCEISSPDVFRLEPDGTLVYRDVVDEGLRPEVEDAIDACPTQAIRLVD